MAGRKTTNKEKIEKAKKELETLSAILGKILDDTMTQTEAARKLGITPQEFRNETIGNFTNYAMRSSWMPNCILSVEEKMCKGANICV